jgi:hypothetical protein
VSKVEYKINIDRKLGEVFSELKESKTVPAENNADVIRRAVALYNYLHKMVKASDGSKVAILDKNDKPIIVIDPLP